jgi:DNA-binding NtrC family response regulator
MNIQSIKQRFGIIGTSAALDRAIETAARVANTDLSVLITGESGVGKEVFSKVIHSLSARKHNNFIPVNCGAIPAGTINSELFGHEKGSFTGATGERKGYFETVDGGTIFLDEIGEMPLDTQAYLLRVLETGEFLRVGSSKPHTTDVRVIAATNVDLKESVRKGKFREDLYYRLNTVPIFVPPLRERPEDINLLFRKFASDFAEKYRTPPVALDERAQLLLEAYAWPGNIRELKNVAEQLSVLSESRMVTAEQLVAIVPNILTRHLPAKTEGGTSQGDNSLNEREILYKLLFDMKNDLNDLKSLVFEIIKSNDLSLPNGTSLRRFQESHSPRNIAQEEFGYEQLPLTKKNMEHEEVRDLSGTPIILPRRDDSYSAAEVVEDTLSIEDMEKELIVKALKKFKGRRKETAAELGISERTLYRKIKQYGIEE